MLHILWFQIFLPPQLAFLSAPIYSFVATLLVWLLIALAVNYIFFKLLRYWMRRLPGDVEDIVLGILHEPVLILLLVFGAMQAIDFLLLPESTIMTIQKIAKSITAAVLVYLGWRIVKDVLVYYGQRWAVRTESRLDDVLIPVLNLVGPLVIVIIASLIILPVWGVNVSSVLLGAGVVGLVLALALQDPLGNIFSGISLLIEAPFRTGDLIVLQDDRVCQVERLGLRSTQFYSVDEHSTIFVPNRTLTNTTLVNITQPTVEQKVHLDISVGIQYDLVNLQTKLKDIAIGHPNVVVADMQEKIPLLKKRVESLRAQADVRPKDGRNYKMLLDEANKYEEAIPRLELEDQLNRHMRAYQEALRDLIRAIQDREEKGLSKAELKDLLEDYVSPADEKVQLMLETVNNWSKIPDPWVNHREFINDRMVWVQRNEQLQRRWERLKNEIRRPSEDMEMRLDDEVNVMMNWLENEYKIPPYPWKNPTVTLSGFSDGEMQLQLWFHVDNIRLEQDTRARRVKTEIARFVLEQLSDDGIW
jgi:MscS family membrane protein